MCITLDSCYAFIMEFGMLKVGNSIDIQRTDGMCLDKICSSSVLVVKLVVENMSKNYRKKIISVQRNGVVLRIYTSIS